MGEEIVVTQMEQVQQVPPMAAGMGVGMIIVMLVIYVFWAYCLARIAVKTGMPLGKSFIWALIPIANFFLILKLGAKPMWWFVLLLIPIVNVVMMILIWIGIVEKLGKPAWWGVCIAIVPILNLILFLMLAFEKGTPRPATV
ncbi:MAG: DUF5684 domain-containing protein [Pseudomonadota bacterium]